MSQIDADQKNTAAVIDELAAAMGRPLTDIEKLSVTAAMYQKQRDDLLAALQGGEMTPATVTVENNRLRDVITTERNCNIIIRQNGKPVFDLLFKDGVLQVIGEGGIILIPDAGNSVLINRQ